MLQGGDFAAAPELGYEEWRAVVRSIVGRYNPEGTDPNAFAGKVHVRSLFGLRADRWDHNAHRIERTQRDVRLDDIEFYHAVFQVVGRSTVLQNDQAVILDIGDVALVDSTRPVTYVNDAYAQWLSLQLPRRSLVSHLGLEPPGGRRGTRAGRLLFQLVLDEFKDELTSTPESVYMQLALYDLIGEIFTPSEAIALHRRIAAHDFAVVAKLLEVAMSLELADTPSASQAAELLDRLALFSACGSRRARQRQPAPARVERCGA